MNRDRRFGIVYCSEIISRARSLPLVARFLHPVVSTVVLGVIPIGQIHHRPRAEIVQFVRAKETRFKHRLRRAPITHAKSVAVRPRDEREHLPESTESNLEF